METHRRPYRAGELISPPHRFYPIPRPKTPWLSEIEKGIIIRTIRIVSRVEGIIIRT